MPAERLLLFLASLVAAASLARAAVVSRSGARLGGRWTGHERRTAPREQADRRRTAAWLGMAGLVLLLGGGRLTGGLEAISNLARQTAKDLGWYAGRGPWQMAATGLAAAACLGLALAVARSRRAHRRQRLAIAAAAGLTSLLAVRAVSWHAAGLVLWRPIHGVTLATWLEVATLLTLTIAGVVAARPHRRIRDSEGTSREAMRGRPGGAGTHPPGGPSASTAARP